MNMSGAYQNPIYNQQMQQYGQQYAYNPYMNQPRIDNAQNYMQAPQQIQQQIPVQTFGINGKVVPASLPMMCQWMAALHFSQNRI